MMYKNFIKPLLFMMSAEKAHNFTLSTLSLMSSLKLNFLLGHSTIEKSVTLFGLNFKNQLGLAAGLDKNAVAVDAFAAMGFGFVEIGTVTPLPQAGNPLPRLFRLKKDESLINRMGFNNEGVVAVKNRLEKRKSNIIIGGNIGKNKVTPNKEAVNDYLICFHELFDVVDYFVVNVSSPNTPGLRALQEKKPLTHILNSLMEANLSKSIQKPILLKIAPDLSHQDLDDIIEIVFETQIAGLIATNTTIDRSGLATSKEAIERIGNGGLSGKAVGVKSTEVLQYIHEKSEGKIPVIGVGGICSEQDALDKIKAGASLVQIYSGMIYEGPSLITRIIKALNS